MPQLFQVLRCYKCLVFQVHQTKKSNKWQCKMCGEKQSIKRHYSLGSGKECRLHVQKLNGIRGETEEEKLNSLNSDADSNFEEENVDSNLVQNEMKTKSKWSLYIENEEKVQVNEPMYLGNIEVCLEIPSKKKRKPVTPMKKEYVTNGFKTPYKLNSEEITSMPFPQKIIDPINAIENVSNTSVTNEITDFHRECGEKKVLRESSKWAQFVESEDFDQNDSLVQNNTFTDKKKLFQLCDDTDLDDVLDI